MCTVTYIPGRDSVLLTSSRDEHYGRPAATPPLVHAGAGGNLLFPKDTRAGGSWFAVHEHGHALVLLNGAGVKHISSGPYRMSRGLILLELADCQRPAARFDSICLKGIEPFTMVILEEGQLHECCWGGATKYHGRPDSRQAHIWSSVTLYGPGTVRKRREWFAAWLAAYPSPDQHDVLQFHLSAGEGDKRNDLLMERAEGIRTVSITSLMQTGTEAAMRYLDIPGGGSFTNRFLMKPVHSQELNA